MKNRSMRLTTNGVLKNGDSTSNVFKALKRYQRRIQQLVKHHKETGEYPVLNMKRHPQTYLTAENKELIK